MEDRNDAPAFPVTAGNQVYATGMTLRDWFAGQGLPGIIAQPNLEGWDPAVVAKWAYQIADAMMEARK